MYGAERIACVRDASVDHIDQPQVLVNLTQQQRPRIGRQAATTEVGLNASAIEP
jgi:hypothetical protein